MAALPATAVGPPGAQESTASTRGAVAVYKLKGGQVLWGRDQMRAYLLGYYKRAQYLR